MASKNGSAMVTEVVVKLNEVSAKMQALEKTAEVAGELASAVLQELVDQKKLAQEKLAQQRNLAQAKEFSAACKLEQVQQEKRAESQTSQLKIANLKGQIAKLKDQLAQ